MKRRKFLSSLGVAPLSLFSPKSGQGAQDIIPSLVKRWKTSKAYSLAVLASMPDEHLEYSPTESQMTFAQHFLHFAFFNNLFIGFMLDEKVYESDQALFQSDYLLPVPDGLNLFQPAYLSKRPGTEAKKIVGDYVAKTFDFVISNISQQSDSILMEGLSRKKPWFLEGHTNLDLIIRGENHTAHHRAQAVVYLRMKGIVPPGYGVYHVIG